MFVAVFDLTGKPSKTINGCEFLLNLKHVEKFFKKIVKNYSVENIKTVVLSPVLTQEEVEILKKFAEKLDFGTIVIKFTLLYWTINSNKIIEKRIFISRQIYYLLF